MSISLKRKCCMAVSIYLLLSAGKLPAQSHMLSLRDLVDAARANQPSLLKKQAAVSSAEAAVTDAQHLALPSLKIQEQVSLASANSETGTLFPLGAAPSISGAIRTSNNYQPATGNTGMLYSEYELENFGLNKARTEQARADRALSQADLEKDQYLIGLRTARYYFQLLKAFHQLDIEAGNVKRYDTLFSIISAQAAAGLRPGADSAQTRAERSKAIVAYNSGAGTIDQLKQELSLLTGIPGTAMMIDTSLSGYSDAIAATQQEHTADSMGNPLTGYYLSRKQVYLSQEKFIRKSYLPKILLAGGLWARGSSITGQDDYEAWYNGLSYQRFNYGIALAFSYNLFDGIHRRDKLAVNKFRILQSDYELQEQLLELSTSRKKAQIAIDVINKNKEELPVQVESARALYQQKLAQYQAGVSNLIDLTNAAFLLRQVETDNIQILTDWFLANLDKATAEGSLDRFIQSIK